METAHFRVHYTREYEEFAKHVASQIESIRTDVSSEVGYTTSQAIDVVVQNPFSQLSGEAITPLAWPRIVLWAYPPEAGGELGTFSDWAVLLVVHEETHIAHLLRPTRNPLQRLLSRVNPIAMGPVPGAPRWVLEGFATVIEGRLTGFGRPNGAWREVILRTWARSGRLPTYGQLASDRQNWLGMSMAYLAGSSFLEWLERRQGAGSLKLLWASMSARQQRSFDVAFQNVFGDLPSVLYGFYTAELTHAALDSRTPKVEGEVWQDLRWRTERPDVSPDGATLTTVLRSRTRPPRLTLFSTLPDEKGEKEYAERIERMLQKDPQDVRPIRAHPLARKPLHELVRPDLKWMASPRFIGSTGDVLFVAYTPDAKGDLHSDLFRWTPSRAVVTRLTRQADLRDPSVSEDGSFAVAVRTRNGKSQLVRFDLMSRETTGVTIPSLDAPVDDPAVSHDGRIVFVRNEGKGWVLIIRENGVDRALAVGDGTGDLYGPVFSADGRTILVTASRKASTEIWRVPLSGLAQPLTSSAGAAFYPVDDRKGGFFYLGLDPDGVDIRHFTGEAVVSISPELENRPTPVKQFVQQSVPEGHPYGLGGQEMLPLVGFNARSHGESNGELLLRLGDIVGRLDTTISASYAVGSRGVQGIALRSVWRGSPIGLDGSLFHIDDAADLPRTSGGEVSALREWQTGTATNLIRGGVAIARIEDRTSRRLALRLSREGTPHHNELGLPYSIAVGGERGSNGEWSWTKFGGSGYVGVSTTAISAIASAGFYSGSDLPLGERYVVGGSRTSLESPLSSSSRLYAPELQRGVITARGVATYGIEIGSRSLSALHLFANRVEGRSDFASSRTTDAFGFRSDFSFGPMPILKLPALSFTAGIARVRVEGDFDTNVWAGVSWKP